MGDVDRRGGVDGCRDRKSVSRSAVDQQRWLAIALQYRRRSALHRREATPKYGSSLMRRAPAGGLGQPRRLCAALNEPTAGRRRGGASAARGTANGAAAPDWPAARRAGMMMRRCAAGQSISNHTRPSVSSIVVRIEVGTGRAPAAWNPATVAPTRAREQIRVRVASRPARGSQGLGADDRRVMDRRSSSTARRHWRGTAGRPSEVPATQAELGETARYAGAGPGKWSPGTRATRPPRR